MSSCLIAGCVSRRVNENRSNENIYEHMEVHGAQWCLPSSYLFPLSFLLVTPPTESDSGKASGVRIGMALWRFGGVWVEAELLSGAKMQTLT